MVPEIVMNPALVFPQDFILPFLYTFGFALVHFLIVKHVLKPLSRYVIQQPKLVSTDSAISITEPVVKDSTIRLRKQTTTSTTETPPPSTSNSIQNLDSKREKFIISCWRFLQYTICVAFGVLVFLLPENEWAFKPQLYFKNWPETYMSNYEKIYYGLGFGLNTYAVYDLFVQKRQKDFPAMLTHHVTTNFLIVLSYLLGFQRVGMVVLILHDLSDPLMELAKACLYAKQQLFADIFITFFAITFFFTRLFVFPVYVISSIPKYGYWDDGTVKPNFAIHYSGFGALCVLQVLHVYWGYLILRVVYKAIMSNGVQGDVRDDDEED